MKTLFLSCLLAGTAVAGAQTNQIDGQIYITRKDRETVKLSLVTVQLVQQLIAETNVARALECRRAQSRDQELRDRANALTAAMPRMSKTDYATAQQTWAKLRAEILRNSKDAKLGLKSFFNLLSEMDWQPRYKVETDADGKFAGPLPPGQWTLVAFTRRKVVDINEEYIWIEPVTTSGRILLNNSNLFDR